MIPEVCIIIPFYNAEPYLQRCLQSILCQSYDNWICVLINDGSTDNSERVARPFLRDSRFRLLIAQKNGGGAVARNTGLIEAMQLGCPYLMFVDADDWIDEDYLEKMLDEIKHLDAEIITSIFSHEGDGYSFPNVFPHVKGVTCVSAYKATKMLIEDHLLMSHSHTKLYKSAVWKGVSYPPGIAYMEDQATVFKAFSNANRIALTDMLGYHYWEGSNASASRSPFTAKKILDAFYGYFESLHYDFRRFNSAQKKQLQRASKQSIARLYLRFYPRIGLTDWNAESLRKLKQYEADILKEKMIWLFRPSSFSELLKKVCYLISPALYKRAFRRFKKLS